MLAALLAFNRAAIFHHGAGATFDSLGTDGGIIRANATRATGANRAGGTGFYRVNNRAARAGGTGFYRVNNRAARAGATGL